MLLLMSLGSRQSRIDPSCLETGTTLLIQSVCPWTGSTIPELHNLSSSSLYAAFFFSGNARGGWWQCYLEWAGFVPQKRTTLSFCLTMLFIFRHLVTIWPLRWFPAFLMLFLHFVNLCWSLLYCSHCCRCCTESLHNSSLAAFGNRCCTWELQFRLLARRRVLVFL